MPNFVKLLHRDLVGVQKRGASSNVGKVQVEASLRRSVGHLDANGVLVEEVLDFACRLPKMESGSTM